MAKNKLGEFELLVKSAHNCTICPRMADSRSVLTYANGDLRAIALFIGEAPGRLGADDTGIPFHGDRAGENFEELIGFAGIARDNIFVTNAVLCNPKDSLGNNSTPNPEEVKNCSDFLRNQIKLIDPRIVVTLGAVSLSALKLIEHHDLQISRDVRTINPWFDRHLIPLYHPGQRAMMHRSHANQRSDYQFVREQLSRLDKVRRIGAPPMSASIAEIIKYFYQANMEYSYFALHKLLFLAEHEFVKRTGHRLTSAFYIRQKDGPYCTELHYKRLLRTLPELAIRKRSEILFLYTKKPLQHSFPSGHFTNEIQDVLDLVLSKYGKRTNSALKTAVYLTPTMREILKIEREENVNIYNSPIRFFEEKPDDVTGLPLVLF
jgi:uracil-DNA glycosylase family 4